MLQEYKSSNILKLQGKDIYNKTPRITENRRRGATLDYSLGVVQLQKVGNQVLAKRKADNLFYEDDMGKQFTNAIVSVSFEYNVCEYNKVKIGDMMFYKHNDSPLTHKEIKDLYNDGLFVEGVYKESGAIVVIKIGEYTSLSKGDLPTGFKVEEGVIRETTSGSKVLKNGREIRQDLYDNGFKLVFEGKGRKKDEEIEYVRFLRSAGQARVGTCLFIDKRLFKPMIKWCYMNLDISPRKKIDLAGLEAYISLVFSSIVDTVELKKENILVIDDYESSFLTKGMVTSSEPIDGIERLITKPMEFKQTNSIWDGQSLLDVSVFGEKYKSKGMLLLRNRFAKSCAFNCNIQQFFEDNNITEVSQLNGFTLAKDIKDIKLITTPSSVKYVKYGTIEEYLDKMDSTWGVVKYDKPTHHFGGKMVSTHYQLLNTLEMSYEDMEEFLKPSLDYYINMKTNIEFFKLHLKLQNKDSVEFKGTEDKDEFIFKMLQINDNFQYTNMFKTFRKDTLTAFKNNLKRGHVLVNGNYSTLCGNPLEMLQSSIGAFDGTSFLNIDEVCVTNFNPDIDLVGSRSPHVANGNVLVVRNCSQEKREVILKYMNFSRQIIYINAIGNNILETLSGADFDSDTIMLTDNALLLNKAKINYGRFLTPTGNVKAKKVDRYNTSEDKANLDITTDSNLIGVIINCSQNINSRIWELWHNGNKEEAMELYIITSQLDVMSNLAIDSAKREFPVDLELELKDIKEKFIDVDLKPKFFEFISKDKGNKVNKAKYRWYDTPMDYLIRIVDKTSRKRLGGIASNGIGISELINDSKIDRSKRNPNGVTKVLQLGLETRNKINGIWSGQGTPSDKYYLVANIKEEYQVEMEKVTLYPYDIRSIINTLDRDDYYSKAKKSLVGTLFNMYPNHFTTLFTNKASSKDNVESFPIYHFNVIKSV